MNHRHWSIEKRPGRWTLTDEDCPDAKKPTLHWGEAGSTPGTMGLYSVISHCIKRSEGMPGTISIRYLPNSEPLVLHYDGTGYTSQLIA